MYSNMLKLEFLINIAVPYVQLYQQYFLFTFFFLQDVFFYNIDLSVHSVLSMFLLQETQKEASEASSLDVYLMNGHKITVKIMSTDQTEDLLEVLLSFPRQCCDISVVNSYKLQIKSRDPPILTKFNDLWTGKFITVLESPFHCAQ